jgi:hypothetical protein
MRLIRIVALACLLLAGSCSSAGSRCSGPEWPFYTKTIVKNRAFNLIGQASYGARFIQPAGCGFMVVGAGTSATASSAIDLALAKDRLKGRQTVITGRFDGEISPGSNGDPVAIVAAVRDLKTLDGQPRQDVIDSQFLPPRRSPERDPSKPIVEY